MENKNERAVDQLKKGIQFYVDKKIDNANLDKTVNAIINKVNENETYNILINGVEYLNIKTIGGKCELNEVVKVLIPQNNYNLMTILKGGHGEADLPENIVLSADDGEVKDLPSVDKGVRNLYQLDDVNLDDLKDKEVLTYDEAIGMWVNSPSGGGIDMLKDLKDVEFYDLERGDVLTYRGGRWVNEEIGDIVDLFKAVSVEELPPDASEHPNIIYLIQGTVG